VRYFWTTKEEKILRENYPGGGIQLCSELLTGRSESAIYNHAGLIGLTRTGQPEKRRHWATTEEIDRAITNCYQKNIAKGAVADLAKEIGRPRWWVSKRAAVLGLKTPRFKELPWKDKEKDLLREHAHRNPDRIVRIFKRRGFVRSTTAIVVMRKRMQLSAVDDNRYTACLLAREFGVDAKTVLGWINKGWLKATRRGTGRVENQGGDMWWIKRRDIRSFVVENAAHIDLRKVDKVWFIDLLA
jgi:hypothetical protein